MARPAPGAALEFQACIRGSPGEKNRILLRCAVLLMAATSDPYPEGAPPGHIVLYGNPTSRVCKVLWVCAELGVPVISVPVWEQRKEPWFTRLNPKQAVPVVRDGDLLLHESNTIVTYLAAKYGWAAAPPATTTSKVTHPDGTCVEVTTSTTGSASGDGADSLLPVGPEATAVASMWTEYAETTIAPKQNPIFFGKVRLGPIGAQPAASGAPAEKRPGCPSDEALLEHVPGLVRAWTAFEEALEGKLYVAGDAFTIGDICAAVQVPLSCKCV